MTTPQSINGWTQTGRQAGSNPGGVYTDENGQSYYVKFSQSSDHARNEILASRFYKLAGIRAAEFFLIELNGRIGVASPMIAGAKQDLRSKLSNKVYMAEIHEGFAVDAWLANWDVAGLVFDNIVTGEDGHGYRVDPGGSLLYRAMGSPKGSAFGVDAGEMDTLLTSPQAGRLFAGMTQESLKSSVMRLTYMSDALIAETVESVGFRYNVTDQLIAKLIARRDSILAR